jgi:hypothetical protein
MAALNWECTVGDGLWEAFGALGNFQVRHQVRRAQWIIWSGALRTARQATGKGERGWACFLRNSPKGGRWTPESRACWLPAPAPVT